MKPRVETTQYRFAHGREPRGYGLWCFELEQADGTRELFQATGSFAETKAAAIRRAREIGADRIVVGS